MDRSLQIESWWRRNGGLLQDVEDVLPYIVCDQVPGESDEMVNPLLVGAESFQAKLLDTSDPRILKEELAAQTPQNQRRAVEERLSVFNRWEPDVSVFSRSWAVNGRSFQMQYVRLLAPVKTKVGGRMLITYTAECAIN